MGLQLATTVTAEAPDGRRPLHPLVDRLLAALRYEKALESWSFTGPLTPFAAEIQGVSDAAELSGLLGDLARLGYFLEVRRRSPDAAMAIVSLLQALLPQLSLELFEGGPDRWRQAHAHLQREHANGKSAAATPNQPKSTGVGLRTQRPKKNKHHK